MRAKSLNFLIAASIWVVAPSPLAAECWQGFGYWADAQTRAYKSDEMLLVTQGPATWAAGQPVTLLFLDRATGRIDRSQAPIVAVPLDPRAYYRGNSNYVDGMADVEGAADRLIFGLSHVAPPSAAIPELKAFMDRACGLENPAK